MIDNQIRVMKPVAAPSTPQVLLWLPGDDDPAMRASLEHLLRSVGIDARSFVPIPDHLNSTLPDASPCLILDMRLSARQRP